MKKIFILLSLMMVCSAACFAANKTFQIKGKITAIEAAGNVKVEYTISNQVSVVASTDADFLKYVTVTLRNGKLTINYDTKDHRNPPSAEVKVAAPAVGNFTATGNSTLEVESALNLATITAAAGGNSTLEFDENVTANTIKADSWGNSTLKFDDPVKTTTLNGTAGGNSTLKIKQLNATTANIEAGGNATANVAGTADSVVLNGQGNATVQTPGLVAKGGSANASGNSTVRCNVARLTTETCSGNATIKNK